MNPYVNSFNDKLISDEKINRFIFLHMAQSMGSKQKSLKTIQENLLFSFKKLSEVMTVYRSFFCVELKKGVKIEESCPSDILVTLNKNGLDFFIKNVVIPDYNN